MKFKGKVENNRLVLFNRELFNTYLKSFEGKHIDISVKLPSKIRNLPQNSRHWARMAFAANVLGDRTPEELHFDFRSCFLTDRTVTPPRVKSSTDLNTKEFSEWEENIDRVLAEQGIVIPEPEEL